MWKDTVSCHYFKKSQIFIGFAKLLMKYSARNCFNGSTSKPILWMRPVNERRHYIVTSSLIGSAHTQNDSCYTGPRMLFITDIFIKVTSNRHRGISNHRPLKYLLKSLFRQTTKKHYYLCLCVNSPVDFPNEVPVLRKTFHVTTPLYFKLCYSMAQISFFLK